MKGGELAEDEERAEAMQIAEYLQVNVLVQQERSRASKKDCNANSFWLSTQDFFLEELLKEVF